MHGPLNTTYLVVMLFAKTFVAFLMPYRLAFESQETLFWVLFDEFIDFIFFIDIIVIFNLPYYD
jgi:hypothetical protein